MDCDIINNFLKKKGKLHIFELKNIIYELKNEASKNKIGLSEKADIEKDYYFYDGEVNAYCICLDLIEELERR